MDTPALSAIKTPRVTDTVVQMLREGIVSRAFAPGSKINVDEVAKQLHVSRTPVHEALTMLAGEGLVEIQPRRGTYVAEFTPDDYAETLDLRRALEVLACETACVRASDDDVAALEDLMHRMERSVHEARDPTARAKAHDACNLEFHQRLVELSGNRRLISMYADLRAHVRIARAHLNATTWLVRVPIETAEHAAIVEALRRRDVAAMQRALDAHLRRSSASLIEDVVATERGRSDRTGTRSA